MANLERIIIKHQNENELNTFFQKCEDALLNEENRKQIDYPQEYIESWNTKKIKEKNESWLKTLRHNVSVYAIFTAQLENENFTIRYIGQSKSIDARNRLSSHLIKKDKRTGSKLQFVKEHIKVGGKIKVSHILIEPESLRHYIEEELIKKYSDDLDWNSHTKKKT